MPLARELGIRGTWEPSSELVVPYAPAEKAKYKAGEASVFDKWRWSLPDGRNRSGSFAEVCARRDFELQGYRVLVSEPRDPEGFLLVSYPGKREVGDPAFQRVSRFFADAQINELVRRADDVRRSNGLTRHGGDPDLFVYSEGGTERFFVEVKDVGDRLRPSQLLCFPLIEEVLGCDVRIVHVEPEGG